MAVVVLTNEQLPAFGQPARIIFRIFLGQNPGGLTLPVFGLESRHDPHKARHSRLAGKLRPVPGVAGGNGWQAEKNRGQLAFVLRAHPPPDGGSNFTRDAPNLTTMKTAKEIKAMADKKREAAEQALNKLFNVPDGYSSNTIDGFVRDIMDATILELSAIKAEVFEENKKKP